MQTDLMVNRAEAHEAKLRRWLCQRGYALQKSRTRDPENVAFGGYQIVDAEINGVVGGWGPFGYSFDLDDVAEWIADCDHAKAA